MKKSSTVQNACLNKVKIQKDDELYTNVDDIDKEIIGSGLYLESFCGKSVICGCNDTEISGFWRFFLSNFRRLKLKKLTAVSYVPDSQARVTTYNGEEIDRYDLN